MMLTDYPIKDEIPFTQYSLPDGRQSTVLYKPDPSVGRLAGAILKRGGFRFECEILTTGEVSLTCHDTKRQEDIAIQVCANGPGIHDAVDRMIRQAHGQVFGKEAATC